MQYKFLFLIAILSLTACINKKAENSTEQDNQDVQQNVTIQQDEETENVDIVSFAQVDNEPISVPLKLGKYKILQYRANIREEPTRNSNVITILSINDEIELLENSGIEEKINNVWGLWYKSR